MRKIFEMLKPREDPTTTLVREIRDTLSELKNKKLELQQVGSNTVRRKELEREVELLTMNFKTYNRALTNKPCLTGVIK